MIEKEFTPMIGIETIQMIENTSFKIIDHAIILTTDRTIENQSIITIKMDNATIHKT